MFLFVVAFGESIFSSIEDTGNLSAFFSLS